MVITNLTVIGTPIFTSILLLGRFRRHGSPQAIMLAVPMPLGCASLEAATAEMTQYSVLASR